MTTDIYYFSGTGNSYHAAKELQKSIPDSDLIPIVSLLKEEKIKTKADKIGFVFPNFCLSIPIPFDEFLKKLDVSSADYIFAVCTRGGTPSKAFDRIDKILKKQGKRLDAQININMPWNTPIGKDNLAGTATKEKIERLEKEMNKKIDEFSERINEGERYIKEDVDHTSELPLITKIFDLLIPDSLDYWLHKSLYQRLIVFYSDSKCVSCSICEKVCPSEKIKMTDDGPVWQEDVGCYGCMACISYCPNRAVQARFKLPSKSYTQENDRYHHPKVSYRDIAGQKR